MHAGMTPSCLRLYQSLWKTKTRIARNGVAESRGLLCRDCYAGESNGTVGTARRRRPQTTGAWPNGFPDPRFVFLLLSTCQQAVLLFMPAIQGYGVQGDWRSHHASDPAAVATNR